MLTSDDTIAAISTPVGEGGIGIVRLSGPAAISIAECLFSPSRELSLSEESHRLLHGHICDPKSGAQIDEVLLAVMKSPHSYTKEDIVEINCHGGMITLRKTLEAVLKQGARLAEPGEFTKRAFLNGRLDLIQAEAVLDLIRSKTDESRRVALEQLDGSLSAELSDFRERLSVLCANVEASIDFPEDEIETVEHDAICRNICGVISDMQRLVKTYDEARFFREGLLTAIAGRPNVGKSSLLNALLKKDRAIVNEIPGTTRDLIEEYLNIHGLPLRIIDTAGIRTGEDAVEKEGVKRSLACLEAADLVLAVFDPSLPLTTEDLNVIEATGRKNVIAVFNKCDLPGVIETKSVLSLFPRTIPHVSISATRGDGIEELKRIIFESFLHDWKEGREGIVVTNLRHKMAIEKTISSLNVALSSLKDKQPLEITAIELRDALDSIGSIVGAVTSDDILNRIFSDFCIGK